jgi:putative ABC transport system permease protein
LVAALSAAGFDWFVDRLAPRVSQHAAMLPWRVCRQRETAVAVSGVVASLSLAVALTVMVASFRIQPPAEQTQVLPADLWRSSGSSSATSDTFTPDLVQAAAALPGLSD